LAGHFQGWGATIAAPVIAGAIILAEKNFKPTKQPKCD